MAHVSEPLCKRRKNRQAKEAERLGIFGESKAVWRRLDSKSRMS
jgi:hypothetical protein